MYSCRRDDSIGMRRERLDPNPNRIHAEVPEIISLRVRIALVPNPRYRNT